MNVFGANLFQIRTAFNFLGPMLNPAAAPYALVGVYDTSVSKKMADALLVRPKPPPFPSHALCPQTLMPLVPS